MQQPDFKTSLLLEAYVNTSLKSVKVLQSRLKNFGVIPSGIQAIFSLLSAFVAYVQFSWDGMK